MIKVKHLLEAVEKDDGARFWVEPHGLTKDLMEWCKVDHVVRHLAPPAELLKWFEEHPNEYSFFRAQYHEWLGKSRHRPALLELARAANKNRFTLLHDEDDPEQNAATALFEFITELESYTEK